MPHSASARLCALMLSLILVLLAVPCLALAPNQVVLYPQPGFQGYGRTYTLQSGYRHLAIYDIRFQGKVPGSIRIGSDLAVRIFEGLNLEGFYQASHVLRGDSGALSGSDGFRSMIVFRRVLPHPQGVALTGRTTGQIKVPVERFFPLPDSTQYLKTCYSPGVWTGVHTTNATLYGKGLRAQLTVEEGCNGSGLTLPAPGLVYTQKDVTPIEFKGIAMTLVGDRTSSVMVQRTPEPQQLLKGLTQPKVVTGVAKAILPPRVAGRWQSSIKLDYDLKQDGQKVTWTVVQVPQKGQAVINGRDISATWQDATGSHSGSGKITSVLKDGYATRIEWNNGVVFFRTLSLDQPKPGDQPTPVPGQPQVLLDLAGTWKSDAGVVYQIQQNGASFSWTVPGQMEKGQGKLNGYQVAAQWQNQAGGGKATGKVTRVTPPRRAMEILWDNGVRFKRQ